MSRNIRSNYLSDKVTFASSTMPIGSIFPVFKADDDKVADNGVVTALGAVASLTSGGSGYYTDLTSVAGYETVPVELTIAPGNLSVGNDEISYPNHPFIDGDKITVVEAEQAPNIAKLGGSIQSINVTNGGSGYNTPPSIQVTDAGSGPVRAGSFQVVITNGEVTGVNVLDGGALELTDQEWRPKTVCWFLFEKCLVIVLMFLPSLVRFLSLPCCAWI